MMSRNVFAATAAAAMLSLSLIGCAPQADEPSAADALWATVPEYVRDCPTEYLQVDVYAGSFGCVEPGHERWHLGKGHPDSRRDTLKAYCEIIAEQGEQVSDACAEVGVTSKPADYVPPPIEPLAPADLPPHPTALPPRPEGVREGDAYAVIVPPAEGWLDTDCVAPQGDTHTKLCELLTTKEGS